MTIRAALIMVVKAIEEYLRDDVETVIVKNTDTIT